MKHRPISIVVFAGLLFASAVLMDYLGSMAAAYYAPVLVLALSALLLWMARAPGLLRWLLVLNQATALILIAAIAWRRAVQPDETLSLDVSSLALIANMLLGGPALGILSVPLLALMFWGKRLPAWFAAHDA